MPTAFHVWNFRNRIGSMTLPWIDSFRFQGDAFDDMGLFDGSYLLPETAPLRAPWNFWLVLGKKQEIEKHWIRNEMSLPSPEEDNWA